MNISDDYIPFKTAYPEVYDPERPGGYLCIRRDTGEWVLVHENGLVEAWREIFNDEDDNANESTN